MLNPITIYHNPRCSKSRQALALLEEKGAKPVVVEYLKTPPLRAELEAMLRKLDMRPKDILRRGEAVYKELELADKLEDDDEIVKAIAANPILMERPIIMTRDKAVIGRPPEKALEILES